MKGLTDITGLLVGHATDREAVTGCTAVLCAEGAVAGCDVRGSATGTQEFDTMNPLHTAPQIHGICFAGGSAFGLEAASGVRRFLEQSGAGFVFGKSRIPLVPSAILFDLGIGKPGVRPTREMGETAAKNANANRVEEGSVGAGTGATVGKIAGMPQATKSGLGSSTIALGGGLLVSALVAVNAFGDVLNPQTGAVLAGARQQPKSKEWLRSAEALKLRKPALPSSNNTTLAIVATNARLSKVQCTKLAQLAQHGMIRSISPVHTEYDGDLVIAISIGNLNADLPGLGVAAAEVLADAIQRSVRFASSLGGVPALEDLV